MANIALTVEQCLAAGLTQTYTAGLTTTDTYQFANDGRTFLQFVKTAAVACTVTIVTSGTFQGLAIADVTVTVPATTGNVMAGPFPPMAFNDTAGLVNLTLSNVAGLSVACVHLS